MKTAVQCLASSFLLIIKNNWEIHVFGNFLKENKKKGKNLNEKYNRRFAYASKYGV